MNPAAAFNIKKEEKKKKQKKKKSYDSIWGGLDGITDGMSLWAACGKHNFLSPLLLLSVVGSQRAE